MKQLRWQSDLAIGIPSIDRDRRKLIDFVNSIGDAMRTGGAGRAIAEAIDGLALHAPPHFRNEERILHGLSRAAGEEMTRRHGELERELFAIRDSFRTQPGSVVHGTFVSWIFNQLLPHFVQEDRRAFESILDEIRRDRAAPVPSVRPMGSG